jgi:hypothetical protein
MDCRRPPTRPSSSNCRAAGRRFIEDEEKHEMDARIVKLRFFGGLKSEEIAALLEVSERTAERHWKSAKLWLYRALQE